MSLYVKSGSIYVVTFIGSNKILCLLEFNMYKLFENILVHIKVSNEGSFGLEYLTSSIWGQMEFYPCARYVNNFNIYEF